MGAPHGAGGWRDGQGGSGQRMPYQSFDALSAHEVPNASVVVAVTAVGAPEASDAAFSVPDASEQFGFRIVNGVLEIYQI